MKTITIEELEQIHDKNCCVIDIRPAEQYSRGTFPGAVNIPADQLEELLEEDDDERLEKLLEEGTLKRRTIYVLCHTGERSRSSDIVAQLTQGTKVTMRSILRAVTGLI